MRYILMYLPACRYVKGYEILLTSVHNMQAVYYSFIVKNMFISTLILEFWRSQLKQEDKVPPTNSLVLRNQ